MFIGLLVWVCLMTKIRLQPSIPDKIWVALQHPQRKRLQFCAKGAESCNFFDFDSRLRPQCLIFLTPTTESKLIVVFFNFVSRVLLRRLICFVSDSQFLTHSYFFNSDSRLWLRCLSFPHFHSRFRIRRSSFSALTPDSDSDFSIYATPTPGF